MINKSSNMGWYKGTYLLEAIDSVTPSKRPTDKALYLPHQDIYKIGGIRMVPVRRVETCLIKSGIHVMFAPSVVVVKV